MQTEPVYDSSNYNLRIRLEHRYDNRFRIAEDLIDLSNAILMDNDGNEVQPVPQMNDDGESVDWRQEWEGSTEMVAHFNLDSENEYTLHTGTEVDSEFEVMPYDSRDEENCGSDDDLTEEETFDMFDDLFGNVKSIAWGIGSSADLSLPDLASPISNYTVLGLVQQGTGDSATITAAIGSQVAEPNPEPLVMKNLTLELLPENPSPGDVILVTATDAETGAPVEFLSVLVLEDGLTLFSDLSDYNGQATFTLEEGTLMIRASGGMYNPAEITIIVTEDGTVIDETADNDNDGISDQFDDDDDNDGIPDDEDDNPFEPDNPDNTDDLDMDNVVDGYDLCPNTPAGEPVNSDGCSDSQLDDGDGTSGMTACEEWEYLNPGLVDESLPGNGCPDYEGEEKSSSDSSESKILGMAPLTFGAIVAGIIVAAVVALLFVRRSDNDDDWFQEQDSMFADEYIKPIPAVAPVSQPRSPPPGLQGQMQDGYEVTEYPAGSQNWWWKNQQSGNWEEWK